MAVDVIEALRAHGETGAAIIDLLYGDAAEDLVKSLHEFSKLADPDDPAADQRRRRFTAGLSAVGATAGAAGLALAGKKLGGAARSTYKATSHLKPLPRIGGALKAGAKKEGGSAALLPLEVAGLGGEIMSTKILHGDSQKKPKMTAQSKSADVDITWTGEIAKADTDKRQVFGWASVTSVDGVPVVDLQNDEIDLDEIEKAAYDYVKTSRTGGNMHAREGEAPKSVSKMIESFVVTPEKRATLKLTDSTPDGWWVGFAVEDDDTWAQVKKGELTGFSIHGMGRRAP